MAEYINKHKAYMMLKDLEAAYLQYDVKKAYAKAALRIDQMPKADVQPVTYTRWIELDDRTMCSNCGASYDDKYEQVRNHWKCCPNCEAKVIKLDR